MRGRILVLALVAALSSGTVTPAPATAQVPGSLWVCPMHPDVQQASEGTCPRCNMALVPFKPGVYTPYLLQTKLESRFEAGKPATISFRVLHPRTREQAGEFLVVHERPAHLFIASEDLAVLDHVHPEVMPDGELRITWTPPQPGRYRMFVDVVPAGDLPQMLEAVVESMDVDKAPPPPVWQPSFTATVGGVTARMLITGGQAFAGRESQVELELNDASTGRPIDGWEPWLGAWAHFFALREDASEPTHAHPEDAFLVRTELATKVHFDVIFPRAGTYRAWVQLQRKGQVLTLPFTVRVDGY